MVKKDFPPPTNLHFNHQFLRLLKIHYRVELHAAIAEWFFPNSGYLVNKFTFLYQQPGNSHNHFFLSLQGHHYLESGFIIRSLPNGG